MKVLLFIFVVALVAAIAFLGFWRWTDIRAEAAERTRLLSFQPVAPAVFDPAMVADLPEPAQRYFNYAIAPGTPLYTVARITMSGQISTGTKDAPNYMNMDASQVLAAPHGFLWEVSARSGAMRMIGSDSGTWTRFWLMGIAPLVRAGGTDDHTRSAFGRYAAEAVFWTPAALLPGPDITWEAADENTAKVTMTNGDLEQAMMIEVADNGAPRRVYFDRWTNANPDQEYRIQPFGGDLSEFQTFEGFTVPTRVEAGNLYGTDDYFPFFIAQVSNVAYPKQR